MQIDWDELLFHVDEGSVIPVVGAELFRIERGGKETLLYSDLAGQLAISLGISIEDLPPTFTVADVAAAHCRRGGEAEQLYPKVRKVMQTLQFELPAALRKLARITDLRLFVSLTFDSLLARALAEERPSSPPIQLAFSPYRQIEDIEADQSSLTAPVVYQLFGRLSAQQGEYVVSDEDTLEFIHCLQETSRSPVRLFDALRKNHILVLGCGFPDWLARFLIRVLRGQAFSDTRRKSQLIADRNTPSDAALRLFLEQHRVRVFQEGDAIRFVDELHDRWAAQQRPSPSPSPSIPDTAPTKMRAGAIFLSYAREDRPAALRLRDALASMHLDTWMDQGEIEPGDDWARLIKTNIWMAHLFVPILSRRAAARSEGYFRREWREAIDRSRGMDDRRPFIIPVAIDETSPQMPGLPEEFSGRHWEDAPDGSPDAPFLERMVTLIRRIREQEAGLT